MKITTILNERQSRQEQKVSIMELSTGTMKSYRKAAISDAMKKHHSGGATNEIAACKRAKNIARSVRLELGRRNQIREAVMDMPMDAAKARLADLRDFLASVPRNLSSQEQYDEVDDARDEIRELEAYIRGGSVSESTNSAASSYGSRTQQCKDLLQKITQYLDTHAQKQQGNPDSWGFAGDLAHVASQLEEIWEFLSSGDEQETAVVEGFGEGDGEFSRSFVQSVARGEIDLYDALNSDSPDSRALSRLVDIVAAEEQLHPDDDMQAILDVIYDRIAQKYGVEYNSDF